MRSVPASNVVEVAMAAIKDETGVPVGAQQPNPPVVTDSPPAAGVAVHPAAPRASGGALDRSAKGGKGGGGEKKAGGRNGGGRSKGKVVFTPLYGCDEGATGVGPVSSILEVSCNVDRKSPAAQGTGSLL